MKIKYLGIRPAAYILIAAFVFWAGALSFEKAGYAADEKHYSLTQTVMGIGGGGAVFTPKISPFNPELMAVTVDMGGVYTSKNSGASWERKNLNGQVLTVYYDPVTQDAVYAGGSGLYKSTDGGDSFSLFFPREDDLTASLNNGENNARYLYTRSKTYPTEMAVKDVLVNPKDGKNVFIIMFSFGAAGLGGEIYETRDGGESFEKKLSFTKRARQSPNILFELVKLLCLDDSGTLYFATNEGVYAVERDKKTAQEIYSSEKGLVDIVCVREDGGVRFIAVENYESEGCKTRVFHTADFSVTEDITQKIISGLPRGIDGGRTEYDWSFAYLDATSTKNIYLAQSGYAADRSVYGYGIEGILHYDGSGGRWVYGNNPAINGNKNNQISLKNRGWSDGNYKPYGIAVCRAAGHENAVLYTTITGIYHSPDGKDVYQRYCDVIKDGDGVYYSTTGLNEHTCYGLAVNPYNKDNVFMLNTDFGLIASADGGVSWQRSVSGVPFGGSLNSYDMAFDKNREGVAYSLWSNRHDVPYSPADESGKRGAFLYSSDGGASWNSDYSTGIPADATPVKMSVVYPKESNRDCVIYVATFNRGFFMSGDSGRTFAPLNGGITPAEYGSGKSFILGCDIEAKDGRVFALTAKSFYGGSVQSGAVYELSDGVWRRIELPAGADNPRDIYFDGGTLYISCTTNRKDITDSGFCNYGGGVYAYKDGQVSLIFDGSTSATGALKDSRGTLYVSDINGNIYRREEGKDFEKIYADFHTLSKGIQLLSDDALCLSTLGGGLLKLEGLSGLYVESEGTSAMLWIIVASIGAAVAAAGVLTAVIVGRRAKR